MLKALPGSWAELLPDASRLGDGVRHQESFFYAHGLSSFAQSLLDYLRSEFLDPAEMLTRPEFWEQCNYGALMVQALHLAYGPREPDLSAAFVQGMAELRPSRGCGELVGRVELQFAESLEGQLWIHAVPGDSESRTFSGDKVSFDLGCRRLSPLSGKALEQLSGWRILAPPEVPSESAGFWERRWFQVVLMCLRRVMPQVPALRVLHFARPHFQPVLIGLSHDHIAWQDMEWVYANPKLDVLESSEEELIDLVNQLQSYGCPFRLPFWLSEL